MHKNILVAGIVILFVLSALAPITFGSNITNSKEKPAIEDYNFNRYLYPEYYDCYNADEIPDFIVQSNNNISTYYERRVVEVINPQNPIQTLDDLMDSPWPMYCHDARHTGRSPYSTVDTWGEIWRFKQPKNDFVRGSPVIGEDGTIYFGASDFHALYPNGTLKWTYDLEYYVWSAPAIDENDVLYVGDLDGYFYAINNNGTLKWKYKASSEILSSPAIGGDGTIFFGDGDNWRITALYPNGTLKWRYKTGHVVYSSPAIGQDGTVYCGSHDSYLYALYPNNGTLKWKYKTGNWIRVSPCIADDGTIYVVSFDRHIHAVNPDGSRKWKTYLGEAGTSPTIGQDGTIYCGYKKLHAIYPNNGSVKWKFNPGSGRTIQGATPCHSAEDIIYFGTHIGDYGGGEIIAVNPDGTERWRERIANKYVDSAPAIGSDGSVYVGSARSEGGYNLGYLHAFGIGELEADANGPYYGLINEPVQFDGYSKGGFSPHSYHWDFSDGETAEEQNPLYTYTSPGNYTVVLTVTDDSGNSTNDATWAWIQDGNTPPIQPSIDGPTHGSAGTSYDYTFTSSDPEGSIIWYYIDWDDGSNSGWIGPYGSGIGVTKSHTWSNRGTYTIKCIARDPYNHEGQEGILTVTMPRNKMMYNSLFLRFLGRYPFLRQLLAL